MKQKVLDVAVLALAVAVVLGGYWIFQRVRYHDQMDQALLQILQKQASRPANKTAGPAAQ